MPRRVVKAVPDRPLRVVLYVRVSAVMGRDPEAFHSPAIQLAAMRRAAAGMSEVDVVDDIDVTGTTFSREGLDQIRVMVEAGQVDAIAVYDWSRFGRNVREALNFLQWLDDRHVQVIAAGEQADRSTPEGEFSVGMLLQVAQLHSRMIGRAWSWTIADRAAKGRHHGRPVGYRRVKGQPLQVDPAVGPVVTWAFGAYAADLPIIEIAREVGRRRGRQIYTANLKKMLRNPVYLGHVTAGAEIVVYAAHAPLVDQATWDRVQRRLAHDATVPPRHLAPTWALVGLAYCPGGHRLQRQPTMYRGLPVHRLLCGQGVSRGNTDPCAGIGYPRYDDVEAEVLRQVGIYLSALRTDPAARARREAQRAASSVERQGLERELSRTRGAMTKLAKAWAVDEVPDSAYHGPMAQLRAAEVELVRQLGELGQPVVTVSPEVSAGHADRLIRLWPEATVAERARLVRLVVRRVVVRKAAFWREPECDRVTVEF